MLAAAVWTTAPPNYLRIAELPELDGWEAYGVTMKVGSPAPDGTKTAAIVTANTNDSHIVLRAADVPGTKMTFSVYLRADKLVNVALFLNSDFATSKVARLSPEWQRFSVRLGGRDESPIAAMIGGGESFASGKSIYVWGPQLSLGTQATRYASPVGTAPSAFQGFVERYQLRSRSPWLWVLGLVLLAGLAAITPAARAGIARISREIGAAWSINRYLIRSGVVNAALIVATLATMEVLAFVASILRSPSTVSYFDAAATVIARAPIAQAFWFLGATRPQNQDESIVFSPLTQVARLPGDQLPPYLINSLGLIDNENPDPLLRGMPQKPSGMTRIALYGGSTAMGIGAADGTATISAQLEKLLNEHASPGAAFQVLNFGHGGGQTYTDLEFMVAAGTKLDVDVHISLNGFNDAFFATESGRTRLPYVINWSDFSYHYNNALNNVSPPQPVTLPLLPFISLLFNDLRTEQFLESARQLAFYEALPMRRITQFFDSRHTRDELLAENLRFMAGYFIKRDKVFLSYLQPHPLQFRHLLETSRAGPSERELVDSYIRRLAAHEPAEYSGRMTAMFESYGAQYAVLAREYRAYPNIRFFDIRPVLNGLPVPAYIDIIHYSATAQRKIAERMFADLSRLESIRSRLKR